MEGHKAASIADKKPDDTDKLPHDLSQEVVNGIKEGRLAVEFYMIEEFTRFESPEESKRILENPLPKVHFKFKQVLLVDCKLKDAIKLYQSAFGALKCGVISRQEVKMALGSSDFLLAESSSQGEMLHSTVDGDSNPSRTMMCLETKLLDEAMARAFRLGMKSIGEEFVCKKSKRAIVKDPFGFVWELRRTKK